MKMPHDDFEAWIRERSSGCLEESEINDLCKGDLDFESGEYTFQNQSVQAQWEAWRAALDTKQKEIDALVERYSSSGVYRNG